MVGDGQATLEADFVGEHTGEFAGVAATGAQLRVPYWSATTGGVVDVRLVGCAGVVSRRARLSSRKRRSSAARCSPVGAEAARQLARLTDRFATTWRIVWRSIAAGLSRFWSRQGRGGVNRTAQSRVHMHRRWKDRHMNIRQLRARSFRSAAAALAIGLISTAGAVSTAATADAAPYCGIVWGSLEKANIQLSPAAISSVRAGRHDCFDRMVVDVAGPLAGYHVAYMTAPLTDPAGVPVTLRGGAKLAVTVLAHTEDVNTGAQVFTPANPNELVNVTGWSTFRQIKLVGPSFEGVTQFGLGVRARLPFRVFTLNGPGSMTRVVVDVAHRW